MQLETKLSKCGLFVRDDQSSGLQVFSPFTGLFFCVPSSDTLAVMEYLEMENLDINEKYRDTLGLIWDKQFSTIQNPYLFENSYQYDESAMIRKPLVVNWLITGECNFNCPYCYALDIKNERLEENSIQFIERTANNILRCSPIAVVLTGGEPLLSPYYKEIIEMLSKKTGVILDTNGTLFTKADITYMKKHNVVVRISIDNFIPEKQMITRNTSGANVKADSLELAKKALIMCINQNVPIVVHTVLNKENMNDIESMGNELLALGVPVWKIIKLTEINDEAKKLLPSQKELSNFQDVTIKKLEKKLSGKMRIVIQENQKALVNGVVLVTPSGEFKTQVLSQESHKILIDPDNPYCPADFSRIDFNVHRERYYGR